jgi:hypothetical protein
MSARARRADTRGAKATTAKAPATEMAAFASTARFQPETTPAGVGRLASTATIVTPMAAPR